jgi:Tfp pilus assembly protein PilO
MQQKLSPRERNIVYIVGAVLLLFLADRYAWTPYTEARDHLAADLTAAQERHSKTMRLLNDDKANRRAFEQMIADGQKTDPSATESQMLHAIDDWARDARLSLPSVKRERMEQDKQFGRIVFRATGAGNMASIARFLWDVQTSKLPTRIVDLQITSRQGSKEGSDDLTITVAISTLIRGEVPSTSPAVVAVNTKEARP